MECKSICHFLFLLLCILIKDGGIRMKIFEAYISACILVRAMKLLVQVLQPYIILPQSSQLSRFSSETHGFKAILTVNC